MSCHFILHTLVLLAAVFCRASALNTTPGRLGCFEDNINRVLKNANNRLEKMSATLCINMCQGFKYAGLQDTTQCCCGDVLHTKKLDDSRCNYICPGDPGQTCGGPWISEVFAVEPKPELQGKPLGCFKDSASRVWNTGKNVMQTCTPQRCFNTCRGYKYAGLQNGNECFCGDTLPPTPLPETNCQTQCNGLPGKTCGGPWELEVFELSEASVAVECSTTDYQTQGDLGVYKLFTQRKTWDEAWQQCEDDDAHLVIINSEDEAKFVRSLFAQVPSEKRMHAGFHDLLRKGTYRTLFGAALRSAGYEVWSTQHPKAVSPVQHCGSLDERAQLAQIDGNCGTPAVFVCEKKSESPDVNGDSLQIDVRGALAASNF